MGRGRSDRYWDPCVWGGAAVVGALPPDHVTKDVCGGWVFGYFHHGGRPADGDLLLCRPCEDTAGQQRRLCVCCRQRAEAADLRYSLCIAGYCPGERTQVATPGGAWCASHLRLDKKDQWTQWCSAEYLPKYPKWARLRDFKNEFDIRQLCEELGEAVVAYGVGRGGTSTEPAAVYGGSSSDTPGSQFQLGAEPPV